MPWDRSRPRGGAVNPKYRSKEHRETRARLMAELRKAGAGICAEEICGKRTRLITPAMDLHVCHNRRTGEVRGLGHATCNTSEAARYARSLQTSIRIRL